MDKTFIEYLLNILVLVPVVIILIVISLKLSKKYIDIVNVKGYVEVLQRISLNKDTNIYVVKTGKSGCVLLSSHNNTQVIKDLNEDDIKEVLEMKDKSDKLSQSILNYKHMRKKDYGHNK